MRMTFGLLRVEEENKKNFIPKKGHLSSFEQWAMVQAYCQLYWQVMPKLVSDKQIYDTGVWNGNELYNVEYQISRSRTALLVYG